MTLFEAGVTAAEERAVAAFMDRLRAAPLDARPRLAGADVLRLKGRLVKQWNDQRKVRMPIDLMEPVEIAASVVAAGLLLFWAVPSALDWIPRLLLF